MCRVCYTAPQVRSWTPAHERRPAPSSSFRRPAQPARLGLTADWRRPMSTHNDSIHSTFRFQELDTKECMELLKLKRVGRIVWAESGGPQCLPVNFVLHNDRILFRTSPYSAIARVASQLSAAFEVDDIDEFVGTGWSILVTGSP